MKNISNVLLATIVVLLLSVANNMYAQCPAGETEVTVQFINGGDAPNDVQWDYIAGGFISGLGPFAVTDVVTICVPDGNLVILGCDALGNGWNGAEYVVSITEDGSVNGCGAQDGCFLYISTDADGDTVGACADSPTGGPITPAGPTLMVGPCDASAIPTEGCTDPAAVNYNPCAVVDNSTCFIPPTNDLCVDAVPLCGDPITATNEMSSTEASDPLTTCIGSLENTVWFSFVAASGGPITVDITEGICDGAGTQNMQTHILSGTCGGPYVEEDCTSAYTTGTTYTLNLLTAVGGETYFVYIDGLAGNNCIFDINVSGDFQACCGPEFSLSPTCQLGDSDNFYVDVQVNNIGDNPSGYSVNGGAFPNITATGTVTVGPFPNGVANITFEGLDDVSCVVNREIEFDCSCDPLSVTAVEDGIVCPGDIFDLEATLEEVIPGGFLGTYTVTPNAAGSCTATPDGTPTIVILNDDDFDGPFPLGFNFDFWGNTFTDFFISSNGYVTFGTGSTDLGNDPIPDVLTPNDYIALFWDDLDPGGGVDGTISYFSSTIGGQTCMVVDFTAVPHFPGAGEPTVTGQIIMCPDNTVTINCIDCQTGTGDATSGIENGDGTAGAFDPTSVNGEFIDVGFIGCTTYMPDVAIPSTCNFLYWITDLNNPSGSQVSTDLVTTANPTATTTYYAVVECENSIQCVDEVTVSIDDPANCGNPPVCLDEIAGQIIAPFDCDLSGITVVVSLINDDGSETIVGTETTDANGNYMLAGGPFACGNYSAMLMLPLPDCYADAGGNTGPTGPINFAVNGDGIADGANFAVNPEVPTLSDWGLIVLALLLMIFGTIQLSKQLLPKQLTYCA